MLMTESSKMRPSQCITVRPTTPDNEHIPLYIGHCDTPGLHIDYGAPTGSLDIEKIGTVLDPVIERVTRQALFQSNTGAEKAANVKVIVNNFFLYEMTQSGYYVQENWEGYASRLQMYYGDYIDEVIDQHRDTYTFVTTLKELTDAMIS